MQVMQQLEKSFMQMVTKFDEVMQHFMHLLMQQLKQLNKHEVKTTVFLEELTIDRKQFGQFSTIVQRLD